MWFICTMFLNPDLSTSKWLGGLKVSIQGCCRAFSAEFLHRMVSCPPSGFDHFASHQPDWNYKSQKVQQFRDTSFFGFIIFNKKIKEEHIYLVFVTLQNQQHLWHNICCLADSKNPQFFGLWTWTKLATVCPQHSEEPHPSTEISAKCIKSIHFWIIWVNKQKKLETITVVLEQITIF